MPKKRKANKKHKAKKASGVDGPYGALLREFQRLDQGLSKAAAQKPNVPCVAVRGPFAVSNVAGCGKGAVATAPIVAGTTLLVCKPIAVVTDAEVENECEALLAGTSSSARAEMRDVEEGGAGESDSGEEDVDMDEEAEAEGAAQEGNDDTAVLVMAVASAIAARPQLWHGPLADLYPRAEECSADGGASGTEMPVPAWNASDTAMAERLEAYLDSVLGAASAAPADSPVGFTFGALDRARLKLLVRHNALSVDTSAEQLCFHARYKQLSGLALYHEASFFNHSRRPNVSRYSVGDVLVLRANRDVRVGEELCISYIASEVLCEAPAVRTLMLGGRGFGCDERDADDKESSAGAAAPDSVHGVHGPVLTPEVQDDICRAFPQQRLQEVAQLQADAEFHAEMLRCDHKTLCEIRAVAHMQMREPAPALEAWRQCLNFDTSMLPPYDEAVVAHAVQAALCALAHEPAQLDTAREMVALAATTHAVAFGGGRAFLRTRYAAEVARSPIVNMTGNGGGSAVVDAFWALLGDVGCDGALPLSPEEIAAAAADAATCNQ